MLKARICRIFPTLLKSAHFHENLYWFLSHKWRINISIWVCQEYLEIGRTSKTCLMQNLSKSLCNLRIDGYSKVILNIIEYRVALKINRFWQTVSLFLCLSSIAFFFFVVNHVKVSYINWKTHFFFSCLCFLLISFFL